MTDGPDDPHRGPGQPDAAVEEGGKTPDPPAAAARPVPPSGTGDPPAAADNDANPTRGDRPGDSGARRGRPPRREPVDALATVRSLRAEIDAVREAVVAQSEKATTDRGNVDAALGMLSELMPRFDSLEQRVVEGFARLTPPETPEDEPESAEPDTPPITPAIGWDDMDHDTARAAWEALARFVGDVLHGRYRLKRQQVPDCWPLHPRLIRELAWLRSSYLDAAAMEPDLPPASAPWHTRALPPFIANMLDAVDARECRPGLHRLTEDEATAHITRIVEARRAGEPAPALTDETGVERPRFVSEAFPTRGTAPEATRTTSGVPSPPTVKGLPDLIAGSCEPRWWLGYYHEASAADLAQRRPTPPRPTRRSPPASGPPSSPAHGAASGGPDRGEDAAAGSSDPGGSAGEVPSRFDLDNDPDDVSAGGPDGTGTGGPGGLGGLDGPAGPL